MTKYQGPESLTPVSGEGSSWRTRNVQVGNPGRVKSGTKKVQAKNLRRVKMWAQEILSHGPRKV